MEPPPVKSPSKPPLITPSASPPPLQLSYRMADSAPPVKRQRLFSTPRRTIPEASSSASRPQSPQDVQKEREASKIRLLDVWASLAERYTRRIDEDDIVDIRTGEITKDNGFLRNFRKVDFGAIAAPTVDDVTADESSDTPEEDEEDEYGLDELDAFAEEDAETPEPESRNSETEALRAVMPLANLSDQADAEDLREFMDAEQQRKELCGSDVEEDDDAISSSDASHSDHRSEYGTTIGLEDHLEDVGEVDYTQAGNQEEEEEEEGTKEGFAEVLNQFVPVDLVSEDELDNWDVDEASIVHPVVKNEAEDDNDSDIEFIEPPIDTISTSRSKASRTQPHFQKTSPRSRSQSQRLQKPVHQLYTPPQSQSSSYPSATPTSDRSFGFSRDSQTPAPSPNKVHSHSSVTGDLVFDSPSNHYGNGREAPVPKLDLTQLTKPQKNHVSPAKAPTLKPVVLLTPRKRFNPQKAVSTSAPVRNVYEESKIPEDDSPVPTKTSKGKGKAKERAESITKSKRISPNQQHSRRIPVPSDKKRGNPRYSNSPELIDDSDDPITIGSSPFKTRLAIAKEEEDRAFFIKTPSKSRESNIKKTPASKAETFFSVSRNDVKVTRPRQSKSPIPETRSLSRKRKRVGSDQEHGYSGVTSDVKRAGTVKPDPSNHASTSRLVAEDRPEARQPTKRSSPGRRRTPSGSESETERDDDPSGSEHYSDSYRHKSRSRTFTLPPPPPHYSYPQAPYPRSQHPPQGYPPIPDPRAQFIINQAMQQLSALVGRPWNPLHDYGDGPIPHTPIHRHHNGRPLNDLFITPTHHPHPYPCAYDSNLSNATLPPDSPDFDSSPDKPSSRRRKSLVRRSRSRGRRVSFKDDQDRRDEVDVHSSPPSMRQSTAGPQKERERENGVRGDNRPTKFKAKRKGIALDRKHHSEGEDDGVSDVDRSDRGYLRGQTPGPSAGPSVNDKAGSRRPA